MCVTKIKRVHEFERRTEEELEIRGICGNYINTAPMFKNLSKRNLKISNVQNKKNMYADA